ncbi:S-adenosyl-L-methionine-dependent methyltransferase [Choiromyces venosus 120613-1]|uniref:Trimethylguanosine synthase n=1 Tax=Choiromyces venosus 120613-1 TaxID=1336337 RepID=A0A3N4JWX2_9PEZI|nr:S-adenosyl-L-methionine-dependent methyltransferase [Choiromyces venosus 120613-1]
MARAWTRDKEQASSAEEQIPETPPNGVEIYADDNPPPQPTLNYWRQRYSLFTRYDEGIWITQNGWFEVTPEKVARKIADHVLDSPVETILDVFCGIGGNTIQFALSTSCKRVIAVDKDQAAIDCARHNAKIYGVLDKIEFVVGDVFKLIEDQDPRLVADAVFISPPWGGPSYRDLAVFDLDTMEPYSVTYLVEQAQKISTNFALYLPRTSDLNQIAKIVPGRKVQAIHYCVRQRSKALTVYVGCLSKV